MAAHKRIAQQDFAAAIKGIANDKDDEKRESFIKIKGRIKKIHNKHKERAGGVIINKL